MTTDQRTLLVLTAEILRLKVEVPPKLRAYLADALERMAGVNPSESPNSSARFTPRSGRCWRCGQATLYEVLCSPCWGKAPKPSGVLVGNDEVRAWIEADEAGKGQP